MRVYLESPVWLGAIKRTDLNRNHTLFSLDIALFYSLIDALVF
jgi:hypothetical protein